MPRVGRRQRAGRRPHSSGGRAHGHRALYLIAVCRLSCCRRTRNYAARRAREGKSQREIIRCLKRYIAREIYTTLLADLTDRADTARPRPRISTTILCGNPGFGINRKRT